MFRFSICCLSITCRSERYQLAMTEYSTINIYISQKTYYSDFFKVNINNISTSDDIKKLLTINEVKLT